MGSHVGDRNRQLTWGTKICACGTAEAVTLWKRIGIKLELLGRGARGLILILDHLLALVEHLLHGGDAILHGLGWIRS